MRASTIQLEIKEMLNSQALLEYSLQSWNGNSHARGFIQSNFGFDTIKTTTTTTNQQQ